MQGLRLGSLYTLHHFGASPVRHHAAVAGDVAWHALFLGGSIDCLYSTYAVCVLNFAIGRVEQLCDVLVRL